MGWATRGRGEEARSEPAYSASTQGGLTGPGLGLTLAKQLALLMGGDVQMESTPDTGSTFSFKIGTGNLSQVKMIEA